ncbi:hypothetical protein [Streptomyces sp. NPDC006335]|uniref:hypothetical protein n=1 Tax=Streptomyces sp. NPDC006335 TaxID=3156895 RepID=UPI00339F66C4
MLITEQNNSRSHTTTWTKNDDPRNYVYQAFTDGIIEDALRALGDPMQFANIAADDRHAKEQLRSVSWLLDHLQKRRDALIVALRDRRDADPEGMAGASWTDLVKLIDPEEPNPVSKRSKIQQMYKSGRERTGLPSPVPSSDAVSGSED